MRDVIKKAIALLLVTVCSFLMLQGTNHQEVYGASKYVTRDQIIQMIIKELGVKVNQTSSKPYIEAAKKIGLITNKSFTVYNTNATKAEVAMLLVRADEYINGVTVSEELVNEIIEKRISDITKVRKLLRPYLAKAYALGYIKGSSNGVYCKDRKFNPQYKVTITYAKQLVSFIHNKEKRHQISPDGQLIRTKNLPEFAEYYPYILESFPNEYYDWEFMFMKYQDDNGPLFGTSNYKNLYNYAAPKDFRDYNKGKQTWYTYASKLKISSEEMYKLCSEKWERNVYDYVEAIFNIDYRNLKENTEWIETIIKTNGSGIENRESTIAKINDYIENAIANKTIVESDIVGLDKSSLYIAEGCIYIRVYIKFCVHSSEELDRVWDSPIVFTDYPYPNLINLNTGNWREGYYDVEVTPSFENCGIREIVLNDYYHDNRLVKTYEN